MEARKGESFSFHNKGEKKKRRDELRRDYGKRQEGRGDERKEAGVKERKGKMRGGRRREQTHGRLMLIHVVHTPVYILTLWF